MKFHSAAAAVVTDSASGLGRASADALAAIGLKVTVLDLNEEVGEAVAATIGGVLCKVAITSEDAVVAGFEKARAEHRQERVPVHCAQISKGGKTLSGHKRYSTKYLPFRQWESWWRSIA